MKFALLFLAVLFFGTVSCFAQAQTNSQLSLGAEYGIPVGTASALYGTVIGASAKFERPVAAGPFSFTLTVGITDYLVKLDNIIPVDNATYVPLEVGGKYYFSKIAYFEGDLGASLNVNSNYSSSRAAFIYAPIIGVSAPTNKHKATIDIGLRYEGRVESGGTIGQIAARVAYRFRIK